MKGQVTGTKTRILGTPHWISSVTYYDDRYRVIQTITRDERLSSLDRLSTAYNFPGWVLGTYLEHNYQSRTLEIRRRYTYDHAGRLLQGYHQLVDDGVAEPEVLLAENKYNALGELIEKNLHVEGGTPHQSVDYRYNIRGWLQSINNSPLTNGPDNDESNDLFGMELIYNGLLNE